MNERMTRGGMVRKVSFPVNMTEVVMMVSGGGADDAMTMKANWQFQENECVHKQKLQTVEREEEDTYLTVCG